MALERQRILRVYKCYINRMWCAERNLLAYAFVRGTSWFRSR